jgi:ubiquinone/menaquinone biosynthesis C-methylase UbiE
MEEAIMLGKSTRKRSIATDDVDTTGQSLAAMREYYDRRAAEYDETVTTGLQPAVAAELEREGDRLGEALAALPPALTLDVACGTGLFTRHFRGRIVALDRSLAMLRLAGTRLPTAFLVQSAVPHLPFGTGAFERLVTAHFYGHLVEADRLAFLAEAARVARQLVVVDSASRPGTRPDGWQERRLLDGSRYRIYKRHFTPAQLRAELSGGEVIFAGNHFVAIRAALASS